MAWLMRKSIAREDSPMVNWTPETIEEILKSNAEVVARYPHLSMDHPEFLAKGGAATGHHTRMPERPHEAVVEELFGPLPDALTSSIVNDRIKNAVEAIEPGVHQFIPTIITMPDGSRDASWWAMRICHSIDAIAAEHCVDFHEYRPKPTEYPDYFLYRSNEDNRMRVAVYKDRLARKAIWWDWRFQHTFFSEQLGQYFLDNSVRGYCLPVDELKRSMHVIEV
ncbi:MAG: DUF1629 domain-containing protein [Sphingorhabdus sp.]